MRCRSTENAATGITLGRAITRVLLTHGTLVLALMALLASSAWGYRPFVSTDAAVAERHTMEIELGYVTLTRTQGEGAPLNWRPSADAVAGEYTFTTPQLVVNYGFAHNLELVGEFKVEEPRDAGPQLIDPALFVKAVLQEGILQEKAGVSIAVEIGPLLPATRQGEQKLGFEGVGIVSATFAPVTFHLNFGGGVDREEAHPFAVWGVIMELPMAPRLRVVGEVNGESVHGHAANNSGLLGFLWQPPWPPVVVDAGIRRGFSRGAPDWLFTAGLTFGFPLPASRHE